VVLSGDESSRARVLRGVEKAAAKTRHPLPACLVGGPGPGTAEARRALGGLWLGATLGVTLGRLWLVDLVAPKQKEHGSWLVDQKEHGSWLVDLVALAPSETPRALPPLLGAFVSNGACGQEKKSVTRAKVLTRASPCTAPPTCCYDTLRR